MCQAVFNACPGILEAPKAVANTALEVHLSKCGIAGLGVSIGLGLGHEVRVVIVTVTVIFLARHRLGCDLCKRHRRDQSVRVQDLTLPHHDVSPKHSTPPQQPQYHLRV